MTPQLHPPIEARELGILELLDGHTRLSQRDLAARIGTSVGFANQCLHHLIECGYVEVIECDVRPFAYRITPEGKRYRQALTYNHYRSVVGSFHDVERRINNRLAELKQRNASRVVFYGAGDVMDVALLLAGALGFEIICAVDDDARLHGQSRGGLVVNDPANLPSLEIDAVVITTFRHADDIESRLKALGAAATLVWHL